MTEERYRELANDLALNLEVSEMLEGWHFCDDFDGLLTQGEQTTDTGACAFCGFDKNSLSVSDPHGILTGDD